MSYISPLRFIVVGVIVVTMLGTPVSPALATTASEAEQIEILSKTLVAIGEAIRNAANLSDAERLALYTQLVSLSNAIILLQSQKVGDNNTSPKGAKETEFTRAVLYHDYDNPTVVTTDTYFATSTNQAYVSKYPKLKMYTDFPQRMSAVRQFGTYELSQKFGITQNQARQATHVTGYNPSRGKGYLQNSPEAHMLVDDFGVSSIINSVSIFPGEGEFSIELKSDQNESLIIFIGVFQNKIGEKIIAGDRYSYSYAFKIDDPRDKISTVEEDQDKTILVSSAVGDLDKENVSVLINNLFGKHPLAKEISNYNDKIFEFLLKNKAYLSTGRKGGHSPKERDCYDKADVLVMNELAGSLLATMKVQHEPVEKLFSLQAPVFYRGGDTKCKDVKQIF